MLIVWCLSSMYIFFFKYMLQSLRSTHLCLRRLFDDVSRRNFGFDFWSGGHLRTALVHLPIIFGAYICFQSTVIDISPKFKMAAAVIFHFQFVWIWTFRRVDSVVFVFMAKFGSNISYSHWDWRTYVSEFHLMTSRESTSGFDFKSCGHFRMAVLLQDVFIQSKVIDISPKFKMAAAAILDFLFMWTWPFGRVDSVVFVFYTKFVSNICYKYASDLHLMTSRESISGFDFWSRGHIRMVMLRLPI